MPGRCRKLIARPFSWLSALLGVCFAIQAHAANNQCLQYLPENITSSNDVRICTSSYNGIANQYICRDYVAGDEHYRVLYQGGTTPKAILKFDELNHKQLVWSPLFGDEEMRCPLAPPDGIPRHAKHRGIGVCHDENDAAIPCSVYEYAEPRSTETYRYMVMHDRNGKAPADIKKFVAGKNVNAVEAEISFQIGMSLLETDCCREQGLAYVKHAYELFPHADTYRVTYHRKKAQLAVK